MDNTENFQPRAIPRLVALAGWTVRASQSVEQWKKLRAPVRADVVYGLKTRCVTRRRTISERGEAMLTWYYKAQSNIVGQ